MKHDAPRVAVIVAAIVLIATAPRAAASESAAQPVRVPVAVRYWGGPTVTLETWWHAPIAIDPSRSAAEQWGDAPLSGLHATRDQGDDQLRRELAGRIDATAATEAVYHDHHVSIVSKPPLALRWEVDGVVIVHWQDFGVPAAGQRPFGDRRVDVLILPIDDAAPATVAAAIETTTRVNPRFVLPVGAPGASPADARAAIAALLAAESLPFSVERVEHNTFAVGAARAEEPREPVVLSLADAPWQPSSELADLLDKMDAACRASQEVFAPLSAEQMSFRPGNGTHTPRWNVEHMLGRQLGFFSQIFAKVQPAAFTPVDLNPAQMPPDYQPAHPEWTGADEAAHMQRANAFVRRFAYLLDGLDFDAKAPGTFWTPRRLLLQMERHFNEHTANVVKKFDLPDWPR